MRAARGLLLIAFLMAGEHSAARPAQEQTHEVGVGDNFFDPQEIRIDVGDTVRWNGGGLRPHTVTSDDDLFDSGRIRAGDDFDFTFDEKGTYFYHCTLHGDPQRGMWGVVIVGEPKTGNDPRLVVPDDYPTIQAAVDNAEKGTTIVVRPGTYEEAVTVTVPKITIKGVDRFRTVMDGGDALPTGLNVTANKVSIRNLTVRNYTEDGVLFDNVSGYTVAKIDSIKNRRFGVRATGSYDGVIQNSLGYGSGAAAFSTESCFGCGALLDEVRSRMNFAGFLGNNATGITIRKSTFKNNGTGVLLTSSADQPPGPGQGALIYDNMLLSNNVSTIPPAGLSLTYGLPFGTGVWLAGVSNTHVVDNTLDHHELFGVLVTDDLVGAELPVNNRVTANTIGASGLFPIAWDGAGSSNCFNDNMLTADTGPPGLQTSYPCSARPFQGTTFEPVTQVVDAAVAVGSNRPFEEPPEPDRPSCQKGRPGCEI